MTERKKKQVIETDLDEAVARFIQTDKKELEDEIARAKRESEEIEKYVEERRDSIGRGARRSKHRFRI